MELCSDNECSLYFYRFGKNPARAGIGNKNANIQKHIELKFIDNDYQEYAKAK